MGFCTISELQKGVDQTLGFKMLPHCTSYCTDDDDGDDDDDDDGGVETTVTPSCGVQYMCKCNFTYCHKKSTAFCMHMFMKLTNAQCIVCVWNCYT
jgi:hypothetical protein